MEQGPYRDKVDQLTTAILRTEDGPGLVATARGHGVEFEVTEGTFVR